jgi:exopolyphosphatase/guanosine-5'-triphosphate,3'-diphosphate pyrophosphatase
MQRHARSPVVAAAADVGSTSVHLVVAAVHGRRLHTLADESAFLGLGEAVDARSHLGPALIDRLAGSIAGFAERAGALGATRVVFVGTDPLRRAADAATAVHAVGLHSGCALHVLTQREEAMLTLLGVTEGRPVDRRMLVVDVGGGSTEFVVATPDDRPLTAGVPLGATRLTRQIVRHDPPTRAEIDDLRQAARELLAGAPDAGSGDLVLVGGTATNLVRVAARSSPAGRLTSDRVAEALDVLTRTAAADVAADHAIRAERARLLPAGAAIVAALLERYGSTGGQVSEAGVREGTIRALARAGAGWRDALPELARGWR